MPSRRALLASAAATGVASLAGCLSAVGLTKRGYIQEKWITVEHEHEDGRTHVETALGASLSHPAEAGAIDGWVSEEYADFVDDTDHPTVSDDFHRQLDSKYDRVRYGIGVCGPDFDHSEDGHGCLNTWTSRADFNRVQVYDRVEVTLHDGGGRFDVLRVRDGETVTPPG